jgi:hypothetical protein
MADDEAKTKTEAESRMILRRGGNRQGYGVAAGDFGYGFGTIEVRMTNVQIPMTNASRVADSDVELQ